MKKTVIIALAASGFAVGAFAQGSIYNINNSDGIYLTTGVGNFNTTVASGASYYGAPFTLEVLFSSAATANEVSAINALNGTAGGGPTAAGDLTGDGFQNVGLTGGPSTTAGSVLGDATGTSEFGNVTGAVAGGLDLSTAFAPNTAGYFAFVITGTGAFANYSTVLAFSGSYGGNPATGGLPTDVSPGLNTFADNGINADLTTTSVPEPGTIALACLGGASLLLFRRKK